MPQAILTAMVKLRLVRGNVVPEAELLPHGLSLASTNLVDLLHGLKAAVAEATTLAMTAATTTAHHHHHRAALLRGLSRTVLLEVRPLG